MRILFTIFFIFSVLHATSQVLTVRDIETSKPLESVTVTSENPKLSAVTNALGQADISEFVKSELIEIRMIGYSTQRLSYNELKSFSFNIFLTPSVFSIDQVVVSATKWSQTSREVPVKITSISQSDIQFHNPQTAADLLGASGDVFVQKSQQGGGSPMIRGFATNRLLIVVDGVRMNNAIFRSGNLQNVISIDPLSVERAEVLFGPGSVTYGSDAIGGVMSYYTLSPKYSLDDSLLLDGKFSTRYSSANAEKMGHLDVGFGWQKWAMIISFSFTNFGDIKMGSFGPDEYLRNEYVERWNETDVVVPNPNPKVQRPNGYSQYNLMQKISFKPSSSMEFAYGFYHSSTSNFDRFDRLILYRNGLPRSAQWYYGPQVWTMNNLRISSNAKHLAFDQVTVIAAHQYFKESRHDRNFNGNTLRNRTEMVNAVSVNLDFRKSFGEHQKLLYGIEGVHNDVNSSGTDENILTGTELIGPSRYPQSQWISIAAFTNYQNKISEKIVLQTGVRYNQFLIEAEFDNQFYPFPFTEAKVNKGALTGSVGATYTPTNFWRFGANLSTGFRSPNVDDLGKVFDSAPGKVVVPNPQINAEYAYNAEFSLTRLIGNYFEIDFLGYFTLLDNAMVVMDATLNGQDSIVYDGMLSRVQSVQNAAYAKVYGVQADFELYLPKGFMLSSRFNYQKGIEELDDGTVSPLRHAAPWFGLTKLSYSASRATLELYANFSGEVTYENLAEEERGKPHIYAIDNNGNPYSPAWYTINFRSQFRVTHSFVLTAGVENITDRRYRPYSSGLVAPGINFIGAVKISF